MILVEFINAQWLVDFEADFDQNVGLLFENSFWGHGRVDRAGLDADHHATVGLQVELGVVADDSGLVWLGDVGEDAVDLWNDHSVFVRGSGVRDDWVDVVSGLGHF